MIAPKGNISMYRFRPFNMLVGCTLTIVGIILIDSRFGFPITLWSFAIICWVIGSIVGIRSVKYAMSHTDESWNQGLNKSPHPAKRSSTESQYLQLYRYASSEREKRRWISHNVYDIKHFYPYILTDQYPEVSAETESNNERKNPYRL